ncbi:MAG: signal peptidase I [Erysipelothrix sp.]|nr:signal peptidase I [Erysipelothrix sp.]
MKKNMLNKTWNYFTTLLTVGLLIFAFLLVGVRFLGYTPYAIISGSMEPAYPVGSLVYVQKVDVEEIEVNTPITFVLNEDLVVATHRVVDIDKEAKLFKTKGDANNSVDGKPVHFNNVLGVVKYSLPYLGYLSVYLKSRKGLIVMISLIIVVVISTLIKIVIDDNKNEKQIN